MESTMTSLKSFALLTSLAIATSITPAPAVEQVELGQLYFFHSPPVGTCPGLDWHTVVDKDREITGWISWEGNKHLATVTGKLNPDDTFQVTAKEVVGGNHMATVTGKVASGTLTFTINGSGTGCDGKTWKIQRSTQGSASGGAG
jgi:hypothetical protein